MPPDPAAVCAVVVTFHPDQRWPANLAAVAGQVGHTVVVDNGSDHLPDQFPAGVELARLGRNLGVATALNHGVARARAMGFPWILTMDQDSRAKPGMIAGLGEVFRACPFRNGVGVFAANFVDAHRGRLFAGQPVGLRPYVEQAVAITSGSLVRTDAITEAGPFRDDFFVDFVDHEFCLRLRRHGWRVVYSRRPLLDHAIGDPARGGPGGRGPATSNHSALRRYYITRNRLVTAWAYLDREPRAVVTDLWRVAGEAVAVTAFEHDRWAKVRAMAAGARDAVLGRMGPRP